MNRIYRLENLGCASCSAKMERKINKLKSVKEANINFIAGKLIIEYSVEETEEILNDIKKIIKSIEPQVELKLIK